MNLSTGIVTESEVERNRGGLLASPVQPSSSPGTFFPKQNIQFPLSQNIVKYLETEYSYSTQNFVLMSTPPTHWYKFAKYTKYFTQRCTGNFASYNITSFF